MTQRVLQAGRLWPADGRAPRRRTLVRLAPLIDVVFILLVFFMLASSFMDWRMIRMDGAGAGSGEASAVGAMLVQVEPGRIRLGGEEVTLDTLSVRVQRALRDSPDQRILVQPAAGVPLQRSVEVLDSLHRSGARDVSMISGLGGGS